MPRSRWRAAIPLFSIGLLLSACTPFGATPGGTAIAQPGTPSAVASETPAGSLEPSLAEPPAARLGVEGGEPVEGQLGTFTWANGGSDAPWLVGSPIRVGAGERLILTIVDAIAVANWTASRVPPGDLDGSRALGLGEGSGAPVAFDAPPQGSWSVNVNVWFENLGFAAYYWLVEVD